MLVSSEGGCDAMVFGVGIGIRCDARLWPGSGFERYFIQHLGAIVEIYLALDEIYGGLLNYTSK